MVRTLGSIWVLFAGLVLGLIAGVSTAHADLERNFAGSVQLDYLAVVTETEARDRGYDASTVELSLKLAIDHGSGISSQIKLCYACHGLEFGMAFFDMRFADELNIRVGRFTPAFGEFPLRHDPANHRTSDKPLAYDMGRMLRIDEWNLGVLPAPWVDNGIEINGSRFFGDSQIDYAVYAIGGPRQGGDPRQSRSSDGVSDFSFFSSATPFYVDNNSRPSLGGRLGATLAFGDISSVSLGISGMGGHYDHRNELAFAVVGADLVLRLSRILIRAEYLVRRTEIGLGDNPAATFAPDVNGDFNEYFDKHGFDFEIEQPIGKLDLIARFDGLRRAGPVPLSSRLAPDSSINRYTFAASYRLRAGLRLKTSVEYYDFNNVRNNNYPAGGGLIDFKDEIALHFGVAGPF